MKYINALTGEVCPSLWDCLKTYISDRRVYGIKSWSWVLLEEYSKYI
jgi:hypothetical protein